MRKVLVVVALLLVPSALLAQGSSLRVSGIVGSVEWRASSSKTFALLTAATPMVQVGDEVKTGPGASVVLTIPDGSYMVVSENSRLVLEDYWSGSLRNIINLMLGQVRFYIQRLGGRPNPYSVRTPTALIAVRGTIFDVNVDPAQVVEVQCLDGRVTVENVAFSNREVILDRGFKTLVRPGEYPVPPVRNEAELIRKIAVRKKSAPETDVNGLPSSEVLAHDNDRRNRVSDPQFSNSRTNDSTQRAKPTLTFPQ